MIEQSKHYALAITCGAKRGPKDTDLTFSPSSLRDFLKALAEQPAQVDCCANCMRPQHEHNGNACPKPYTTVWHAWDYDFAPGHLAEPAIKQDLTPEQPAVSAGPITPAMMQGPTPEQKSQMVAAMSKLAEQSAQQQLNGKRPGAQAWFRAQLAHLAAINMQQPSKPRMESQESRNE